jgi:hypothetical protein
MTADTVPGRRGFLRSAAAVAALTALPLRLPGRAGDTRALRVTLAVFDERFPDARRFAHAVRDSRVLALPLESDVVIQWSRSLRHRMETRTTSMIGLTTYADLVLVRGLIAPRGLRLQRHTIHARRSSTDVEHRQILMQHRTRDLPRYAYGEHWVEAIAQHLLEANEAALPAECAVAPAAPCTLHSWLIA